MKYTHQKLSEISWPHSPGFKKDLYKARVYSRATKGQRENDKNRKHKWQQKEKKMKKIKSLKQSKENKLQKINRQKISQYVQLMAQVIFL